MKLTKKIFSILFEDFHWKLVALIAASLIWFVGMNMSDPFQNQIVPVRLQLDNFEIMARDGVMVLNEDALREINVSVQARGLRSDMNKLNAAMGDPERFSEFITVSVDFRAIDTDAVVSANGHSAQTLRISPNLQSGFEHLSVNPSQIDVALDIAQRQLLNVQVVQKGDVPPGFELQHIRLGNEHVTVRGSRSDLRTIALVQANVDITGVHEDAEIAVSFEVIDANGNDMTERVRLNVTETTAFVRVWQIRQAEIFIDAVGAPATGFAVAEISGEPDSVEIVGPVNMLDEIENIRAEINLNGANGNIRRVFNIEDYLPEEISLRRDEIFEMNIFARIEPIETRTFTIPRGNVRSRGVVGLYQLINNTSIRATISGPRSVIANLSASEIISEFDLRGLEIGVHTVPLSIELPHGLELVGAQPTLMVQIYEPEEITNNGENPRDETENEETENETETEEETGEQENDDE
ncbi:MAG: CdaR family protein [Defluviitaleaceae bacterium]|nr:CdaR family protein [Defluviitaleaceae bacterium]